MVTDDKNFTLSKNCGDLSGKVSLVDAEGDYAVLTFHSDGNVQSKGGYLITFTAVKPSKCNHPNC